MTVRCASLQELGRLPGGNEAAPHRAAERAGGPAQRAEWERRVRVPVDAAQALLAVQNPPPAAEGHLHAHFARLESGSGPRATGKRAEFDNVGDQCKADPEE